MISSRANPKIKNIIRLQKSSERRKQKVVLIEGKREIERALIAGWKMKQLYVCDALGSNKFADLFKLINTDCQIEQVNQEVFEHMAYREGSDGLLALCHPVYKQLQNIQLSQKPLVIVLETVEKPGNLGAILRTADAAKVDAVIICDAATDLYNPNTIRSSLGCIFSNQVVATTSEEAFQWLRNQQLKIYCTALEASNDYLQADYTSAVAIVMGTEADGLSEFWTKHSDQNLYIEMNGIADSLNVSVAAAIVVFEALRQRKAIAGKELGN